MVWLLFTQIYRGGDVFFFFFFLNDPAPPELSPFPHPPPLPISPRFARPSRGARPPAGTARSRSRRAGAAPRRLGGVPRWPAAVPPGARPCCCRGQRRLPQRC